MEQKVVTVLGLVLGPGGEPSPLLRERCRLAASLAEENQDLLVITSGADPANVGVTEAEVMRDILIAQGIKEDRVILEREATSTVANAYFVLMKIKDILGYNKIQLVLVTSDYHMPRAAWIFQSVAKTMGIELT